MRKLLLALTLLLGCQTAAMAQLEGPSLWKNQNGSELRITSASRGTIRGTFTNRAAGFGCQGTPYPVTGTTGGTQIIFTVSFAKCRSTATWRGSVQGLGMTTPWVLRYVSNGAPATKTGFDFFSRFQ